MAYSGGRFEGRKATDLAQRQYDSMALQQQRNNDANRRFDRQESMKVSQIEYERELEQGRYEQKQQDKEFADQYKREDMKLRQDKFAFDQKKFNKGVEIGDELHKEKREDLLYNRGVDREKLGLDKKKFESDQQYRKSVMDNTDADNKRADRKIQAGQAQDAFTKQRNAMLDKISSFVPNSGQDAESNASTESIFPNFAGSYNLNGQVYAKFKDGKAGMPMNEWVASVRGKSRSSSSGGTGRSTAGAPERKLFHTDARQKADAQAVEDRKHPKVEYDKNNFMENYGFKEDEADSENKNTGLRVALDFVQRNYDVSEAQAANIAKNLLKPMLSPSATKGDLKKGAILDQATIDMLAQDSVRKVDYSKINNSAIKAITEYLEGPVRKDGEDANSKNGMGLKSIIKSHYTEGKVGGKTVDLNDSVREMKTSKAFVGDIAGQNSAAVRTWAKDAWNKTFGADSKGSQRLDSSAMQYQIGESINAQLAEHGTNANDKSIREMRNFKADLKARDENPSYTPTYREDVLSGVGQDWKSMDMSEKQMQTQLSNLIITSERSDSRSNGGRVNALNTLSQVASATRDYISQNPSSVDKETKQEYLKQVKAKMASYVEKASKTGNTTNMWLSEQYLKEKRANGNTEILNSYGIKGLKGMLNKGAEEALMKTLRGARFIGGVNKIDLNELTTDPKYAAYASNIQGALSVLKENNDQTVIVDELVERINDEIDPSFDKERAGGLMTRTQNQDKVIDDKYGLADKDSFFKTESKAQRDSSRFDNEILSGQVTSLEEGFLKDEPTMDVGKAGDSGFFKTVSGVIGTLASPINKLKGLETAKSYFDKELAKMSSNFEDKILPNKSASEIKKGIASMERAIKLGGKHSNYKKQQNSENFWTNNEKNVMLTLRIESFKKYIAMSKTALGGASTLGDSGGTLNKILNSGRKKLGGTKKGRFNR